MERILVSMVGVQGEWDALSRALLLAKRMNARVFVLVFEIAPEMAELAVRPAAFGNPVWERLQLMIEKGRADGVPVGFFVAVGDHETEMVRFIKQHKITLLVAERCPKGSERRGWPLELLYRIRRRTSCRIELIQPRREDRTQQGRDN